MVEIQTFVHCVYICSQLKSKNQVFRHCIYICSGGGGGVVFPQWWCGSGCVVAPVSSGEWKKMGEKVEEKGKKSEKIRK